MLNQSAKRSWMLESVCKIHDVWGMRRVQCQWYLHQRV